MKLHDHLFPYRTCCLSGEIAGLAPGVGSRHGGIGKVELARLEAGNQAVERLVDPDTFCLEARADFIADVDIESFELALGVAVFERGRSEERRVGKGCVRTCRSGWAP